MKKEEAEAIMKANPDSVTLKRNAKGDLAWDIKCYFPTNAKPEDKVKKVDDIHQAALVLWG